MGCRKEMSYPKYYHQFNYLDERLAKNAFLLQVLVMCIKRQISREVQRGRSYIVFAKMHKYYDILSPRVSARSFKPMKYPTHK